MANIIYFIKSLFLLSLRYKSKYTIVPRVQVIAREYSLISIDAKKLIDDANRRQDKTMDVFPLYSLLIG